MVSIVWPGAPVVTQPWGITDLTVEPVFELPRGWVHWHTGIDVGLYFAPLNAARAGTVIYVGYGLLCIQVGAELDWYVHIDHADVAVGAVVARGQHIAVSGDKVPSGGVLFGAHLHFETRQGPLWVPNPKSGWMLNLNIPTANDPIPVLSGLSSAGGGSISGGFGTMTDDDINTQFNAVSVKQSAIGAALQAQGNVIIGLIKGIPASGGSVDLSVELKALADANAKLDAIKAEEDAIAAQLKKDLAP